MNACAGMWRSGEALSSPGAGVTGSSEPPELCVGTKLRFSGIAQRKKLLTIKPEDLNSNPGTHMVEGQNQFLQVFL